MALINCDFFSDVLRVSSSMTVILPQGCRNQIGMEASGRGGRLPTLYLLHGMSDDHTVWLRRTSIERYVAPLGLAVVMPRVERSYYCDMEHGGAFWEFISAELPRIAGEFFPLSERREDTFVAGLSMGGYGAFKLAFNQPGRFAAAASLSGALDPISFAKSSHDPSRNREFLNIFGELGKAAAGINDLYHVSRELAAKGEPRPRLYQCCGTGDFLYQDNLRFRGHLRQLGYDLTYDDGPGTHDWAYWDAQIQKVLAWLAIHPAT